MRLSISVKILIIITVVFFITDSALLIFGYRSVSETVTNNYTRYTKYSANTAARLLDGVDLEKLQNDEEYAEPYVNMLKDLCSVNDLAYLYVYVPNTQKGTITYYLIIYDNDKANLVEDYRSVGMTVEHTLTDAEISALNGDTENAVTNVNNEFGNSITSFSAVNTSISNESALVGVDVLTEKVFSSFSSRYNIMFSLVVLSSIIALITIAIIIKVKLLKPAEIISKQMKNFLENGNSEFSKLAIKGNDEFGDMANSFNIMTEKIEDYLNNINQLSEEKHRQEAEIGIAAKIQSGLLPDNHYADNRIKISATMIPARYIGGDFYDYFNLPNNKMCMVIADVSGKGVTAALFMSRTITIIRQYAEFGYSPSEILYHTNNCISENNPEQMFITIFVGIYDKTSKKFTYSNAGHNTPYLISDTLKMLDEASGVPTGLFEEEKFDEKVIELKENDTVFMFTDGVNEAVNTNDEFFKTERLEKILSENGTKLHERCVELVLEKLNDFVNDAPQSDDITMLAFSVCKSNRIKVNAEIKNLSVIFDIINQNTKIDEKTKKQMCLAAEEIFVNICSYAYKYEIGKVEFVFEVTNKIVLRFCDNGVKYNPLESNADIDEYDIDTQIGGLGKFLTFSLVDNADYKYINNQNILTLTKNI